MHALPKSTQDIGLALVLGLIVFAGVAYLAFSRSTTRQVDETVMFSHTGGFTYAASSRAPDVYDKRQVVTGDPVFPVLSQKVSVRYDYEFVTEASVDVRGSVDLTASVTTDNGWARTIPITDATPFEGSAGFVEGVLDIGAITQLVLILETESGVENREYEVVITPTVELAGTVGDSAVSLVHRPELQLTFDHAQLYVSRVAGEQTDPLAPIEAGTATVQVVVPNTLSLLSWSAPVMLARWVSLSGLGVLFIASAVLVFGFAVSMLGGDAPQGSRMLGGVMMIPVRGAPETGSAMVELTSFDGLASLAVRMDGVVLEEEGVAGRSYYVQDQYVTYRYREVEVSRPSPIRSNVEPAA